MSQKESLQAQLEQRSQNILTLMALVIVILLIQFWLLSIALEEYMAAQSALALPTFTASGICFGINLWLLKYLYDIDKKVDNSNEGNRKEDNRKEDNS